MRKNQKKVMTGLFAAVGAVSAFLGVRALVSWFRQRYSEPEYELAGQQAWQRAVKATNQAAGASVQNDPQADRASSAQTERMPQAGVSSSARTGVGENYQESFQSEDEPTQASIPTTGIAALRPQKCRECKSIRKRRSAWEMLTGKTRSKAAGA